MPIPDQRPMTSDMFLDWIEKQREAHELVDGVPIQMMMGARQGHNVVTTNIVVALAPSAKGRGCRTTSSDTAVVTGTFGVRYPDVVVDCGPPDPSTKAAARPTMVVEVSSPATSPVDLTDKLDEYQAHDDIQVIMLVEPDIVSVKLYRRDGHGLWHVEKYADLDETIELPEVGAQASVREIYDTLSPRTRRRLHSFDETTRLRHLERDIADAHQQLELTAYNLTENIPIGTYTMVLKPGEKMANFAFMSSVFLDVTGLTREEARRDPLTGFRCVHPDDFDEWVRKNERAFANKERFREETRVIINGETRWVVAESVPRMQADGTWIWEGVISDITLQKKAELALQEATKQLILSTQAKAAAEERQRMLQDIHDGFGNQLAVGKLQLRQGRASALDAERVIESCLDDLRLLFESMETSDGSLLPILANIRERTSKHTHALPLTVQWNIKDSSKILLQPRGILQAARIVQEGLANAIRHSKARSLVVCCTSSPTGDFLVIADDGVGFELDREHSGRGLINMRRRALQEGWRLHFDTDNGGTNLRLVFR